MTLDSYWGGRPPVPDTEFDPDDDGPSELMGEPDDDEPDLYNPDDAVAHRYCSHMTGQCYDAADPDEWRDQ